MIVHLEDVQKFKDAVKNIAAYTTSNGQLRATEWVKIDAVGDRLLVTATTVDSTCQLPVGDVVVDKDGSIAIDQKRLSSVLNGISGAAHFTGERNLNIKTEHGKMLIRGFDPEDFPAAYTPAADAEWAELPVGWADMVAWSASLVAEHGETRNHVKGIYFNKGRILSTNVKELRSIETGASWNMDFLLMKQAAIGLTKVFNVAEPLKMAMEPGRVFFTNGATMVGAQMLEGFFPDTSKIFGQFDDEGAFFQFSINEDDLIGTLKRAMAFVENAERNGVKVQVESDKEHLKIWIDTTVGEFEETVKIERLNDVTTTVVDPQIFNPKYLAELLSKTSRKGLKLHLTHHPMIHILDDARKAEAIIMGMVA